MSKTLGGSIFIYQGATFDYCYQEAIRCLIECCDKVCIVDAGSSDETAEVVRKFESSKTKVICLPPDIWEWKKGKEKLNYFTNIAISNLNADYNLYIQGDEILHEDSYGSVRDAIETNREGFMCRRINLWQDPYHRLNVPHNRLPCSSEIIRLAKSQYMSYGDAESIAVPNPSTQFLEDIRIYHAGFVRKRDVMKAKVIHIQEEIFGVDHDKKLDGSDLFRPELWFSEQDLTPIDEPLPRLLQSWAMAREY
jgi:hypothetical protein